MKAKILGLILLYTILFSSCKKETDPFDYNLLPGKWEMKSEHCKEYFDGVVLFDETYTFPAGEIFLEFKSDRTGFSYGKDSVVVTFKWSRSDTQINIDADNEGMIEHFTIQQLDENNLFYRVRIYEAPTHEEMEYISNCDYTLSRVDD